ncbi:hypothetical protein MesoLj131b_32090 [Mesorhizobium sp. 131-2-5]|nr:hypothetical protein MesoLj131b_32090 [Mesorhizobium sp. 131-2-5]
MGFEQPVARRAQRNAGLLAVRDHIVGLEAALDVDVTSAFGNPMKSVNDVSPLGRKHQTMKRLVPIYFKK